MAKMKTILGAEPLRDLVLIQQWAKVDKFGSIIMSEPDHPLVGEVLATGDMVVGRGVKIGDTVMFNAFAGTDIQVPDGDTGKLKTLALMPFETILCVLTIEEVEVPDAPAEAPAESVAGAGRLIASA